VITAWGRALAESHPGALSLGDRTIVVFPPLAPDLAPNDATRTSARARLGIEGEARVVGTLGGRSAYKGHEYFVRAAARVQGRHPGPVFRVLGAPNPGHADYNGAVEREAADLGLGRPQRIDFTDPGTAATDLLQALDIFVMSSVPHSEGMPTAILEAMALAKPVVSTDVGAVRELVDDGNTGFVVPPRDPDALAEATLRFLGDENLRERFGAAGRERAVTEFGLERLASLHVMAYERALSHRASRGARAI
jgi:glycosyltransferase involved in cell wall biosynthesis